MCRRAFANWVTFGSLRVQIQRGQGFALEEDELRFHLAYLGDSARGYIENKSLRAGRAATQFLVYTMVGSVTMLLSFLAIYLATGTFDFTELAGRGDSFLPAVAANLGWQQANPQHLALVLFAGVFLGFAVKVPLIQLMIRYPIVSGKGVTLASGGRFSAHADFFNAWDERTLVRLVADCFHRRGCNPARVMR